MTTKTTQISFDNFIASLIKNGYSEEVRAFTKSIETKPRMVQDFADAFNRLIGAWVDALENNEVQPDKLEEAESSNTWDNEHRVMIVSEAIFDSYLELKEFCNANARMLGYFLEFINHHSEVTARIGWIDERPQIGRVLWDSLTIEVSDPVMEYVRLAEFFDEVSDEVKYVCVPKPKEQPDPPLYSLHPERFKAFHACAEPIGKIYRQQVDPNTGFLTVPLLNKLMQHACDETNNKVLNYPRRLTLDSPSPSHIIESLEVLSTAYGRFVQAGRQIMKFPPSLIEMLAKTDVDEIPLNLLKTPFSAQYLYFAMQKHLELEEGWFVDGAYVETRGAAGDIRFTITAVPSDRQKSRLWFVIPEPHYTQDFVGEFREKTLATAIDQVFNDNKTTLAQKATGDGGDITQKVSDEFGKMGESMPDALNIVDVSPAMAKQRIEKLTKRHPIYHETLKLVVNALCYVTAYPDDIETVWPDETPVKLKAKAETGNGKESARAKSKLTSMGYVQVHICGKKIDEQRKLIEASTGIHPASHWRRGHWRNQPYGEGRALRKLIWLMPVLVAPNNTNDDPENGHIYLVSK
ncbi:MAG: hypothetical protein CTY19_15640 [Methylomonas sp.]|nr:MAG: hypothetical protein CTY19_15640 [Methylomonas sp.]